MRLVAYASNGLERLGIHTDAGIIDLTSQFGADIADMHDLVRQVAYARLADIAASAPPAVALNAAILRKPLARWGKCFCVGVNYPERNEEYKDDSEKPKYPSLFVRFPESFVGPGEALRRPLESDQLDYEGEVALVIGKAGRRIAEAEAMGHVFGYTIANEGSIHDWIRHGKFNVTPGKNFARSGAIGPWIIPAADMPDAPIRIVTRVNGEVRQDDTTDRMLFPFARIIAYVSAFATLEPGDIILTGTPSGAGARLDPPRYLAPGDRVEVAASGIGTLVNSVRDEGDMD
jgi:2-keto-4-pentenoate hydratase/2-oxohepta-3-ene-1,7-dioic acid hydratase in catechol pathway